MAGDMIYGNDFTTRTSSGAIPRIGEAYTATPYPSTASRLYPYHDSTEVTSVSASCLEILGYKGWLDFSPVYFYGNSGPNTGRPSVDGWFQPYFSKGTATSPDPLYHHTAIVYYDNGNPCLRFGYNPSSGATRTGVALKSIHNVFTNGQLRIQVDFKFPGQWTYEYNESFFMFPVYDSYMEIEAWDGEITNSVPFCAPGLFGMRCGGSSNVTKPYLQRYKADDYNTEGMRQAGNQFANNYSGDNRMPWMRYIVTFDLDAGTMSGTAYSLSDWTSLDVMTNVTEYCAIPHPTFETATNGKKTANFSSTPEYWIGCDASTDVAALIAEKGGISGIGFFVGKVGESASNGAKLTGGIFADAINKPMADNIRVSWKAPGADDFAVAYEDDFSNRTYAVLSAPSSSASAAYPAPSAATKQYVDVFTNYVKGVNTGSSDGYNLFALVPQPTTPWATVLQPASVDGWRQIMPTDKNAGGRVWTRIDYYGGAGGNLMEFGANGSNACVAQPIGEEVTSGKVVLRVDAHLPGAYSGDFSFKNNTFQRLAAALGSSALYTSLTAAVASNTAGGGGIYVEKPSDGVTNHVAFSYGSATALTEYRDVEIGVDEHAWYRYELVADIDAQTYDFTITPLETTKSVAADYEPTAAPIVSETGLPFASAVSNIGAFYLWGYGYGGQLRYNSQLKSAFDNIKIWKISSDSSTTNLLYANDFATRSRYHREGNELAYAATRLAYQYDRDDGPDHWIRRNGNGSGVFEADATIRGEGGNQYLSIGRTSGNGHAARYTASIGSSVCSGTIIVTADMRPPKYWFGASGGSVFVTLGNKTLEQSEALEADAGRLLRFGFRDATGTNNGGCYLDMTPCCVSSSDGTAVGTASGAYNDLCESVDGAEQKWYRFVARVNVGEGTYGISVYDMGTEHPSLSSARGTLVGSATGLSLMNPAEDGISAIDIECRAVSSTLGETGNDPLHALIDNIGITRTKGFVLIVR